MPRRQLLIEIPALGAIDCTRGGIGRQLAEALRNAISRGELAAGERLPSTRTLAESLGVSRGTVTEAYEQLMAEGCLDAQPGASTRVAATLHEPNATVHRSSVEDTDSVPPLTKAAARTPIRRASTGSSDATRSAASSKLRYTRHVSPSTKPRSANSSR